MKLKFNDIIKSILIMLLAFNSARAQQEISLFKTSSPIKGFSKHGALPTNAKNVSLAKVTGSNAVIVKEATDGFVVKAGIDVYKYKDDLSLQWKAVLPETTFGIGEAAQMKVYSGEEATYFVEKATHPYAKQRIMAYKVDAEGKMTQAEYKPKNSPNIRFEEEFLLNGNLTVLTKSWNNKKKAIAYEFAIYDRHRGAFNVMQVEFPHDEYESDKATFKNMSDYSWRFLTTLNDKGIFVKSYFKETEKRDAAKRMIVKLIEISSDGSFSEERELFFEPVLAGEGRLFIEPSVIFNHKDNSLTLTGFLGIDKTKMNALYLLKYDYNTLMLTYKQEHHFDNILKPEIKHKFKTQYSILYPSMITQKNIFFDDVNGFIDLRIVTDLSINADSYFEVKFDKYGDHIKTVIIGYHQSRSDNAIPEPKEYQVLWKDESKEYVSKMKSNPWDYINAKANDGDDTWWFPLVTSSSSILVKFDQSESAFSAIKFK